MLTLGFFFQKKKSFAGFTLFLSSFFGSPSDNNNSPKRIKNTAPNTDVSWFEGEKALIIFYCQ
jgi:hypothetical protein